MKHRTVRGLDVSELGLGAAQFGNLYRATSDAEVEGAVSEAWEAGIRYFDTAPHYGLGLSERRLGRELRAHPRHEYVLSTKVGRLLVANPAGAHTRDDEGFDVPASLRRKWDFSADGVRRSLEQSLERLGLDRVDIVYLHDPDDHLDQAIAEALPALARLRDEGVITAIGAGMNDSAALARIVAESDVDVVMCAGRYTLLEQGALDDLLPAAEHRGVGVVIAGVYNSGLLAQRRPPADAKFDYLPAPPELIERANRIADICESHSVTLPEAALAFPLQHSSTASVVVGARTAGQVRGTIERAGASIPVGLWSDLVSAGLLREESVGSA
ncbi:aldo/keto reductase [Subtercola frigoramans]|uniref:D-threo-aldose 1-dehydrogenase n=1 Tax=Subtercola frigoramans TaxID=120298 RepID=A0ABS2L073_9MICO|nr:aldo/keto reductase [Subtercola frigoramans]MBM7470477.1 D-threo-aldose 1-dehydrogenase [Subtercola frigoramans]